LIYIVSLQYSPVFKSLCYALGNQLKKEGYDIKYLFSSHYEWMLSNEITEEIVYIGSSKDLKSIFLDSINYENRKKVKEVLLKDKPNQVYFHNIHPFFNNYIMKIVKKYGGNVIQHFHEPYVEDKSVYGGIHRYWLYLFEYIQQKILDKTDIAVLSSNEALSLFERRYANYRVKKIKIPLMYEDLGTNFTKNLGNRKYINFVGPPVPAKNPEKFLEIVEYFNKNSLKAEFLLISRAKIKHKKYYDLDNLKIFHQEKISDELIGNLMKKSIMTVTPYKTARQSSVVSMAYMYGTPALAINISGLNEVVEHQRTGYIIDQDADMDKWIVGINFIDKNFETLSKNSRNFFVENFSELNWPRYFNEVFNVKKR